MLNHHSWGNPYYQYGLGDVTGSGARPGKVSALCGPLEALRSTSLSLSLDQYSRDEKEWREGPVYDCSALEASLLLNEQTYELLGA
ncbi:hypothetical protein GRJ2_000000600 [Grus japonensis]|uniref:Uncharacterized protein n=1 Tax=Grus japonensis TaxID=30415 RepID=A0ABC9VPJ8_GRUJA